MKYKQEIHRPNTPERVHFIPSKKVEVLLHPRLLYAGMLESSSRWNETAHSHPFLEVIFINSGRGSIIIGDKTYEARRGDLIVYNAGTRHKEISSLEDPMENSFFGAQNINIMGLPENSLLPDGETAVIPSGDEFPVFQFYFSNLLRESRSDRHYSKEMTESLTRMILLLLLRVLPYDEKFILNSGIYLQAKAYIDDCCTEIGSVEDICRKLRVSRYYLTHLFKRNGEKSPMQYVIQRRMEFAKALLGSTGLSITQVALRCGYENENYFFRVFKTHEKTTPLKYRKAQRGLPFP
jgi:AraC-like DNA-binding protein/mannose-6-phosphate isomerase-like protein (cupin superfamily)